MKILAVLTLFAGLALAGCDPQQQQILVQKYNIPEVPSAMYNCPIIQTYPAVATLTDRQVAKLLLQLHSNNLTCRGSLEAIRKFLANAKRVTR